MSFRRILTPLLTGAALLFALEYGDPLDREQIAGWVDALDSPTRSERLSAEQELKRLGPAVLNALREEAGSGNRSTGEQAALKRLIADLEQRAGRESIQPSRIRLTRESSLGEVANAISLQTGNEFELSTQQTTTLTRIAAENQSFWPAIEEWLNGSGWQIAGIEDGKIKLESAEFAAPQAIGYEAAFRIQADAVERRGVFGSSNTILRVPLRFLAEPRLRPLFLTYHAADFQLAQRDITLAPFSPDARVEVPFVDGAAARLRIDFIENNEADDSNRRFESDRGSTSLAGRVTVTFAAEMQAFSFPLSREANEMDRAGVHVTMRSARRMGDGVETVVAVAYDERGPAFESHRAWMYYNAAELRGPGGERIPYTDLSTELRGDDGVVLRYRFPTSSNMPVENLAGWRLEYSAPTVILTETVPFELNGLSIDMQQ